MKKTCTRSASFIAVLAAGWFLSPGGARAEVAQWDFEGDLESTTGQLPLEEGFAAPAADPDYGFEVQPIGGSQATVAHFQRGVFFRLHPGMPPNGGGAYVNQYSLILDVMFPDRSPSGGWASIYQTNENNANDGDWFVNPDGAVGISEIYGGSVPDGVWHRLALVVDLTVGQYTSFVDGVQVQQLTGEPIDGRFSLYSVNDGGIDGILLFADESQDNAEGYINSVQFHDLALPASEIAKLGGPTAEGIPIPTDPRDCSFRNFVVRYDGEAARVTGSWLMIPGEQGFRVFQGARQIGGDLPAGATTFEDPAPPQGGIDVIYTLKPLKNGSIERECQSNTINTFTCLSGLQCCARQGSGPADGAATITWEAGKNIDITGYVIKVNGADLATLGPAELTYTHAGLVAGPYEFEVAMAAGATTACPSTCKAIITNIPIDSHNDCGGIVNQYDFNGDLTSSTGYRDLEPRVSAPLDPQTDGPEVTFESKVINGQNAQVARYSRGTVFRMFTGLPANGGGAYTNQFTLMMDVSFDAGAIDESGWAALYQSNEANGNDGDWFVRGSDRSVGIDGIYGGVVADDEWHRLTLVLDLAAGTFTSYVNGIQAQQNINQAIDGRFSLYTTSDGPNEGIYLFADESGDNSRGLVNSVQIRDVPMTPDEVAAFGGPTAAGIPYFPPCPYGLSCSLDQQARTASLSWKIGPTASTGFSLRRNGQPLASLPIATTSYTDANLQPGVYKYEIALNEKDADCPGLPLVCQAEVFTDYLFAENFDTLAGDAALTAAGWEIHNENDPLENAAWTTTNPGRQVNPASFNGRPTTGKFLISSSAKGGSTAAQNEAGTGMSHDVWTPAFSAAGAASVWLHFDAALQLNNNGDAVFDVDVSANNGATWENVFRRVSPGRILDPLPIFADNADGAFGRMHVDLGAAAGQASVRLRFRHFEPTWDWWTAIDNVVVDRTAPGSKSVVLPETDFNGFPAGWSAVSGPDGDQTGPWSVDDDCNLSLLSSGAVFPDASDGQQLHHLDEGFALVDPFCSVSVEDEYLLTPALDLSAYSKVFLAFQSAILISNGARAEVLVSLDGGSTFEADPVFSYDLGGLRAPLEDPYYNDIVIEAPAAAGKTGVVFAFHYASRTGGGSTGTWWAIDKVQVTGAAAPAGKRFRRGDGDASGVVDITDPINNLTFQFLGSFQPTCKDALDDDDSGTIDISDPIYSLTRQFLGGPVWPAPYPDCGEDPTADKDDQGNPADLGCQSHEACN